MVQVGRDLTIQGDVVAIGSGAPAMESVPPVPWLGRVPAAPESFVGREAELARLAAAVAESSGRAAVVAVHGLGGIGKSTLAARFAEVHAGRFAPAWWILADSPSALGTGLADLATALAPETADLPVEQRVELAVRWLASHDGWLLVLDNLTGPRDAAGVLERVRTGTVVITSRQVGGWRGVRTVPLDVLTAEEAADLVARVVAAEWPGADLTGVDRLCAELGQLPLAVEQAAAYLAQARITPEAYLDLLAGFPARMFAATAEGGDAQRAVARIWRVTLDRLADTPAAGRLLRVLSWYAPDDIPRDLLAAALPDLPAPDLVDALGRLAAYGMITLTAGGVTVHRLVQAVTRTPDPTDPHRAPEDIATARENAVTGLASTLDGLDPADPAAWPVFRSVLPHVRALADRTTPDTDSRVFCPVLLAIGAYHYHRGATASAISCFARAAESSERLHGHDHPTTMDSWNNLASAHEMAGDSERAITLLEAIVGDRERVLGQDHPDTLLSRNNLAGAYEQAGRLDAAIALFEANLADRERVLGHDHPHTLLSRSNLAGVYDTAGDPARAIPLYEAVLADRERVLGPDHPDTLIVRNNLAYVCGRTGDLDRAIGLYETTLADRLRVLGHDHPYTLASRTSLAVAYELAGSVERAVPHFEAALLEYERLLGPDHPDVRTIRAELGRRR
ncbi:tetratricopeptide repeat protein [Saccharothrix sp. NPDC042600]|uniref:tetratricopeptide repeat protein n=1 Tax=Saccharothrix TaxID=2071 RepID=UPI003404BF8B|nr:FxSxx-COOH system tetratricopeptide repeat protein [Saccharothrix mutabilis subsp. capreolus]